MNTYTVLGGNKLLEVDKKTHDFIKSLDNIIGATIKKEGQYKKNKN